MLSYSLRTYLLQFFMDHISWPDKLLCVITDLFCVLNKKCVCVCVIVFNASMGLLFCHYVKQYSGNCKRCISLMILWSLTKEGSNPKYLA